MDPIPAATLLGALNWRYSTKQFDPGRPIPAETWAALEQALVLAPSSYGLQPWKFVVVQEPGLRRQLSAAAYGQSQPVDCSHFVVFSLRQGLDEAAIDRYVRRIAEVRGVTPEKLKAYRDVISGAADRARQGGYLDIWMSRQVYIALGQFMASAALLGVDTCPMEGLDARKFDQILGLESEGYATLCACAAGYRAPGDKYASLPKVRFHATEVVAYR